MKGSARMGISTLLRGEKVRLTAVTPEDLPTLVGWYEDAAFMRLFDAVPAYPKSEAHLREWVEAQQKATDGFLFAIRPVEGRALLGVVGIDGILWAHRSGSISLAIGEWANQRRGYGREAMTLLLAFAFDELNLHRVFLTVFSYNAAAIRLYETLGFRREGVFREHLECGGQRHDMLLYGLLRREWRAARQGGEA